MAGKISIPKRVGGWKISRGLRKSPFLRGFLNQPMGREIVANALVAAAGAGASALVREREEVADAAQAAF